MISHLLVTNLTRAGFILQFPFQRFKFTFPVFEFSASSDFVRIRFRKMSDFVNSKKGKFCLAKSDVLRNRISLRNRMFYLYYSQKKVSLSLLAFRHSHPLPPGVNASLVDKFSRLCKFRKSLVPCKTFSHSLKGQ